MIVFREKKGIPGMPIEHRMAINPLCQVDYLISSFLAWCLGESVSLENGSLRGSTYHKKYICSLN